MNNFLNFILPYVSKSWDQWTLVFLVVSTASLPWAVFPFSKSRLIIIGTLLIVGHINKHKFGVRIGFMVAGLIVGIIIRLL